jgi:peptidoglycan hydrolase-like protein with peptidoglycan-binding domain
VADRQFERRRASSRPARRRSTTYGYASGSRPDRVAAWALALGILLILLAASTSRGESGGAVLPPAPAGPAVQLGQRLLGEGAAGDDVRTLQRILGAGGFGPLAATGGFDAATKEAVERFQRAAGLGVDGVVGPQTRPALLALMKVRVATWYGPGFYGRRTACGERMTHRLLGVAHRTLPCGTKVALLYKGRTITVPVVDRGPFANGAGYDLTSATAAALGMTHTSRIGAVRASS